MFCLEFVLIFLWLLVSFKIKFQCDLIKEVQGLLRKRGKYGKGFVGFG